LKLQTIEEYIRVKAVLQEYKELEAKLREEMFLCLFSQNEGTESVFIGQYKIKGTARLNRTLDRAELSDNMIGFSTKEIECIEFKPSLSASKYKKLADNERNLIDLCITTKPGMPTLTISIEEEE